MSRKTRITAVGLLMGALASGGIHALPAATEAHTSRQAALDDLLTLAVDRLASLFGLGHGHVDRRTGFSPNPLSVDVLEKEGGALDPNGHH